MKSFGIFIFAIICAQLSFSQTMTVHKKDQTTVVFQLSQIDSITFVSEPAISLAGQFIRGLAYRSGFVWAVHSEANVSDMVRISKINPNTGQTVLQSDELPWNGRGITVGAGRLWIADALWDKVHEVDTSDFHEINFFFTPGSEPNGITFDGTNLWLIDPYFQTIYELSTSGNLLSSCTISGFFRSGMEWEGSGTWTNTDSTTVSFYTTDCTITRTKLLQVVPKGQTIYDIAIGEGKVYISSGDKIYIQDWTP